MHLWQHSLGKSLPPCLAFVANGEVFKCCVGLLVFFRVVFATPEVLTLFGIVIRIFVHSNQEPGAYKSSIERTVAEIQDK